MKILMISNMFPSKNDIYFGSFIRNIKEGLESSGAQVDLLTIEGQGKNLLSKVFKYLLFYLKIFFVNTKKYDVIHLSYPSHTYIPFFIKRTKCFFVVRFHGLEIVSEKDNDKLLGMRRYISKKAAEAADLVVVPSEYFNKEVSNLGVRFSSFKYPSGGISAERFFVSKPYVERVSEEKLKIGYVGRIDVLKGVDVLIQACSLLSIPYELKIIGSGPLLSEMKDLALEKNVEAVFTGAVKNEDLRAHLNDFSVFVFPTQRKGESFGNVAIEAMACGLPIVGSKFAGLTEYLEDQYNGFFFEVGNFRDLSNKLEEFSSLPVAQRVGMSEAAVETAAFYELTSQSQRFYKFLEGKVHEKI